MKQPSLAEKIAAWAVFASILILIAGLLAWKEALQPVSSIGFCAFIGGYFVLLAAILTRNLLSRKRIALVHESNARLVKESASLPDFTKLDTSLAIVSLLWTLDYKAYRKISLVYYTRNWKSVICPVFLGGFTLLICYLLLGIRNPLGLSACFLAGAFLLVAMVQANHVRALRRHFPKEAKVHSVALILDPAGMHYIAGSIVIDLPWDKLKSIRETGSIIVLLHSDGTRFIPSFAFHSPEDIKPFVQTALALKGGNAPPVHDWSSYKAESPVVEGVWPPAIS